MIGLKINGLDVSVEEGTTLLEAARFMGFSIPTLCHLDGLTPLGACRLCIVEIGEGSKARLVSSCTYPAEEGLKVRTASSRVIKARKMIVELLLGNVDLNILGNGTPDEVDREVKELIRDIGPGGGYMVTSGNSLAGYLIPENVIALSRAVQRYGSYPLL